MVGNLEDFARNPGILPINFLELDRTFYSDLKMKMSLRYIDGRVKVISTCMQMINQLDLLVARQKEDLLFI
jgi:hypothetical protein